MIFVGSVSFADTITKHSHSPVVFQIIQDQINFDNTTIQIASIITKKDGSYGGLEVELNPSSTKKLTYLTAENVGKIANLVINDRVVTTAKLSAPFANKFVIYSDDITKEDAQSFIDSLHK